MCSVYNIFSDVWFQCRPHSHTYTQMHAVARLSFCIVLFRFFIYINFGWALLELDLAHNMFDASFHWINKYAFNFISFYNSHTVRSVLYDFCVQNVRCCFHYFIIFALNKYVCIFSLVRFYPSCFRHIVTSVENVLYDINKSIIFVYFICLIQKCTRGYYKCNCNCYNSSAFCHIIHYAHTVLWTMTMADKPMVKLIPPPAAALNLNSNLEN